MEVRVQLGKVKTPIMGTYSNTLGERCKGEKDRLSHVSNGVLDHAQDRKGRGLGAEDPLP
jgi:hypothetical protein